MTFGEILKNLRNEKHITQKRLAEYLNFTRATIAHYETNRKEPEFATIKKIAEFFDVSIDYLLGTTDERNHSTKRFIGSRLRTLRANRTLEEYSKSLYDNTGVEIIPQLLENYEKGKEIPEIEIAEVIAAFEGIEVNYFYDAENNQIERKPTNYKSIDNLHFMSPEIREWVKNPENYHYIEFVYDSYKKGMRLEKK